MTSPVRFPDARGRRCNVRGRAAAHLRDKGVRLPTFQETCRALRRAARASARASTTIDPDAAHPANLYRVNWFNDLKRTGQVAAPVFIELPKALTGVNARIVVALGGLFPMIRAHKVLAAYACLAPRLVAGRFDPTTPARRMALDGQLLPRRRGNLAHSRLPGRCGAARRDEPGAVRLARRLGGCARRYRPHARNGIQRQGDLRQVRGAGARSRQRDRQPVQRVRQLPRALAVHRPGIGADFRDPERHVAGPAARRFRFRQRLGRHAGCRRLPQGPARHEDRRGRGGRMPDAAQQRLWRAQHPGHRRQARAADPQRDQHRSGHRRQRQGHRRAQRRLQHR